MSNLKQHRLNHKQVLALRGLRLPAIALKQLQRTGIYCQPAISIEYQQAAKRHVLRGVESGGAVAELGAYCGFTGANGSSLSWLQRVNAVGRNGIHAIVVAPHFVRIQTFRSGQTYELLITEHMLKPAEKDHGPRLQNTIVFYGLHGALALELWGRDSRFTGHVCPVFFTKSGEPSLIPKCFEEAACRIAGAACCVGCKHCHLLEPANGNAFP